MNNIWLIHSLNLFTHYTQYIPQINVDYCLISWVSFWIISWVSTSDVNNCLILSMACITVVWSRLPKFSPILAKILVIWIFYWIFAKFFTNFGDIFGELKKLVSFWVTKMSPILVTIIPPNFVLFLSPILVKISVIWWNWWVFKWRKFHQFWWQ